jgi:hypothetical protein
MKYSTYLRYLIGPATIIDGLIMTFTLGKVNARLGLEMAKRYSLAKYLEELP